MLTPAQTLLELIQAAGTNQKKQILSDNETPLLRKVLQYSLDPFLIFGIKKYEFAKPIECEDDEQWERIFVVLENLVKRKVTGNAAQELVKETSAHLSSDQQLIFDKILQKDLKCGVAAKTVNKVFDHLIPEFSVQLAHPHKMDKIRYPCICEPKYDGVRTIAIVSPEEIIYLSRNGKQFMNFSCFDKELKAITEVGFSKETTMVFDGEVVGSPGDEFRGIMQQCRRKYDVAPDGLTFRVFDFMYYDTFYEKDFRITQKKRSDLLEQLRSRLYMQGTLGERVLIIKGKKCNSYEECLKFYERCISLGYEGIIVKNPQMHYEFKRSWAWQKIKPTKTKDLKVIDLQEGRGKYKGKLGAVIVMLDGVKVRVGSGFTDDDRVTMDNASELIGKIAEIKYDSVTPDGSLRFPRFIRWREDKEQENV